MPFGEPLTKFLGDPFDLKIPTRMIDQVVAETSELARHLVVIDVLDIFPRAHHLGGLQCLPSLLNTIVRGVEHDAVAGTASCSTPRTIVLRSDGRHCRPPRWCARGNM